MVSLAGPVLFRLRRPSVSGGDRPSQPHLDHLAAVGVEPVAALPEDPYLAIANRHIVLECPLLEVQNPDPLEETAR